MNEPPETKREGGIVRWSVDNPYGVVALFLAVLVLGWLAISQLMPKRFMPYVESPLIGIVTEMPGLSAEDMETYYSSPIEQKMISIQSVRYIRSVSQDGFSMVVLEFPYGHNMQKAYTEVQALMESAKGELPGDDANRTPSFIVKVDPLNLPVLTLALTGDESLGWTDTQLRDLADNQILNRFKTLSKNVYSVSTFGGHRRQLQVRVDPAKLKSVGLSIIDVKDAIDRYNVAKPAGHVTQSGSEPVFRLDTLAKRAANVADYPIKADGTQVVKIGDVAEVLDTEVEQRSGYRYIQDGEPKDALAIHILQNPDASSPVTIKAALKIARQLEKDYPGIRLEVAYNNASFVDILFDNMTHELIIAVVLTGIAVLLFLGEWRGTLIALTAIPTSMAMTLLFMAAFGFSLNSSTLIGLLISIGRLVDDAIIDIHAVERHMRLGKDVRTATIDGISEVRKSVLAGTVVLIVALVPLLFSGGITQLMFVGLCWPIIFGVAFSYFVSMTLTSVLCSRFLRHPDSRRITWFSQLILAPFDNGLKRLEHGYEKLIRWLLRHRFANMVRVLVTVMIGFGFYYFIGSEMMPLADVGQASMQLEMQPGTSFAATKGGVRQLEQIMAEEGGRQGWIRKASIEIGNEAGPGMPQDVAYTGYGMRMVNGASAMLTFSDKDSGRPDVWRIIDRIHERAMSEIPGIRRIQLKEMGSDVMATALAPVALVIVGDDLNALDKLGKEVMAIAKKDVVNPRTGKPDIAQPFLTWEMSKPTYDLVVDKAKAAAHGLSSVAISQQAYYALRGGLTETFYRLPNRRPISIQVRYQEDARDDLSKLDSMFIADSRGRQVPLKELVRFEKRLAPSLIEHDQLRRALNFGGYYRKDGRPSMDVTMDLQMQAQAKLNWPLGYAIEARGDMTQMMDSFRVLLTGLAIALVLMYLILVAQFQGFLQPLQMMFSLPLELSGVFVMLWLMHHAFSTVSIMGVIILSGMDVVTAILMIDLIIDYRKKGMPRNVAVIKASPQRLRPILMTTIITVIVMALIAFKPKSGLDAYQPMGTVIVGGLIAGTILSLVDIPIMHTLIDDLVRWLRVRVLRHDPSSLEPIE
ncbi:MAG: efflux RND transporter permease subunit [Fimbriimonadaceae bacterium]|nr:efflux RND transporter permease subunit [Fimbriimonadaceae bacterium]